MFNFLMIPFRYLRKLWLKDRVRWCLQKISQEQKRLVRVDEGKGEKHVVRIDALIKKMEYLMFSIMYPDKELNSEEFNDVSKLVNFHVKCMYIFHLEKYIEFQANKLGVEYKSSHS